MCADNILRSDGEGENRLLPLPDGEQTRAVDGVLALADFAVVVVARRGDPHVETLLVHVAHLQGSALDDAEKERELRTDCS